MFSFDPKYSVYDVTPVENLFIMEYLPKAKGDHVRVYLYGLMQVYHPTEDVTVENIAKALDMPVSAVEDAFSYWVRRRLMERTSEKPPSYRYVGARLSLLGGGEAPPDDAYELFYHEVSELLSETRAVHGSEVALAYEWVQQLHLPVTVVLQLLSFCLKNRGKRFSFKAAEKDALRLAEWGASSPEDVQRILSRDKRAQDGARKILSRWNRPRNPTDDEIELFGRWLYEYGLSEEDIGRACSEVKKGEPSFAYLDGIIRGVLKRNGDAPVQPLKEQMDENEKKDALVKAVLEALGARGGPVTEGMRTLYAQMRAYAPHETILLTASEFSRTNTRTMDKVCQMLITLQKKSLTEPEAARAYFAQSNRLNALILKLFELWGIQGSPGSLDRGAYLRWEGWGFSEDAILAAAARANQKNKPMSYLNTVLEGMHKAGQHTPEDIQARMDAFRAHYKPQPSEAAGRKTITQQAYTQRENNAEELSVLKRFFGLSTEEA